MVKPRCKLPTKVTSLTFYNYYYLCLQRAHEPWRWDSWALDESGCMASLAWLPEALNMGLVVVWYETSQGLLHSQVKCTKVHIMPCFHHGPVVFGVCYKYSGTLNLFIRVDRRLNNEGKDVFSFTVHRQLHALIMAWLIHIHIVTTQTVFLMAPGPSSTQDEGSQFIPPDFPNQNTSDYSLRYLSMNGTDAPGCLQSQPSPYSDDAEPCGTLRYALRGGYRHITDNVRTEVHCATGPGFHTMWPSISRYGH